MAVRGPYDSQSTAGTPRTLGERIKALRVARRLTQVELGDALQTDQATISLWERDRARPSGASLAGVAAYFAVPPSALESGEGWSLPEGSSAVSAVPFPSRPFELGEGRPGGVLAMDLKAHSERRLEAMEAMGFLMKALQEGRTVWIVAD